ncbi:hypothetical protein D9M71_828240 [compost metagenome]
MSISKPRVKSISTATTRMSHNRRLIDILRKLFIVRHSRFLFLSSTSASIRACFCHYANTTEVP